MLLLFSLCCEAMCFFPWIGVFIVGVVDVAVVDDDVVRLFCVQFPVPAPSTVWTTDRQQ